LISVDFEIFELEAQKSLESQIWTIRLFILVEIEFGIRFQFTRHIILKISRPSCP